MFPGRQVAQRLKSDPPSTGPSTNICIDEAHLLSTCLQLKTFGDSSFVDLHITETKSVRAFLSVLLRAMLYFEPCTPKPAGEAGRGALLTAVALDLIVSLIHVVDELDALTLILEGWVGEGLPATVLTLIFIVWPLRAHCKSDCEWADSHAHRGAYRIRGRADD